MKRIIQITASAETKDYHPSLFALTEDGEIYEFTHVKGEMPEKWQKLPPIFDPIKKTIRSKLTRLPPSHHTQCGSKKCMGECWDNPDFDGWKPDRNCDD